MRGDMFFEKKYVFLEGIYSLECFGRGVMFVWEEICEKECRGELFWKGALFSTQDKYIAMIMRLKVTSDST